MSCRAYGNGWRQPGGYAPSSRPCRRCVGSCVADLGSHTPGRTAGSGLAGQRPLATNPLATGYARQPGCVSGHAHAGAPLGSVTAPPCQRRRGRPLQAAERNAVHLPKRLACLAQSRGSAARDGRYPHVFPTIRRSRRCGRPPPCRECRMRLNCGAPTAPREGTPPCLQRPIDRLRVRAIERS